MTDLTGTSVQPAVFLAFFWAGVIVGVVYIANIILRRFVRFKVVEIAVDFLFTAFAGAIFLYEVFVLADGVLRFYMAFGYADGIVLIRLLVKLFSMLVSKIKNKKIKN